MTRRAAGSVAGNVSVLDREGRTVVSGNIDREYSFCAHPAGRTHFQLVGPAEGAVIVLVPGATLPLAVWEPLVAPLVESGFRVLRYDLPGRGHSSPLDPRSDLGSYVEQLDELLTGLGIGARVCLVGLALGALIATGYALEHRERVSRVALIAPDGVATRFSPGERLFAASVIGDLLSAVMGGRLLKARVPRYSRRADVQDFVRRLLEFGLSRPDFRKAVLTTVRTLPIHDGEAYYERMAQLGIPVRIVWGREDRVTPVDAAEKLRALFGPDSLEIMDGIGHLPFVEAPLPVAGMLTAHFGGRRRD